MFRHHRPAAARHIRAGHTTETFESTFLFDLVSLDSTPEPPRGRLVPPTEPLGTGPAYSTDIHPDPAVVVYASSLPPPPSTKSPENFILRSN